MGVYTLVAGLLGTVSNSLAISVFCKTPKVTFNLSRYVVHAHQLPQTPYLCVTKKTNNCT